MRRAHHTEYYHHDRTEARRLTNFLNLLKCKDGILPKHDDGTIESIMKGLKESSLSRNRASNNTDRIITRLTVPEIQDFANLLITFTEKPEQTTEVIDYILELILNSNISDEKTPIMAKALNEIAKNPDHREIVINAIKRNLDEVILRIEEAVRLVEECDLAIGEGSEQLAAKIREKISVPASDEPKTYHENLCSLIPMRDRWSKIATSIINTARCAAICDEIGTQEAVSLAEYTRESFKLPIKLPVAHFIPAPTSGMHGNIRPQIEALFRDISFG